MKKYYLSVINIIQFCLLEQWTNITKHWVISWVEPLANTLLLQDYIMNCWKDNGAPAEKLIVGFPTYGHTFILSDASNTGIGAPTSGGGPAGPYTT